MKNLLLIAFISILGLAAHAQIAPSSNQPAKKTKPGLVYICPKCGYEFNKPGKCDDNATLVQEGMYYCKMCDRQVSKVAGKCKKCDMAMKKMERTKDKMKT